MKVRLLTLVAAATATLGAQAPAQQDEPESLERALADLNKGSTAPATSNVSSSGSLGLNISGDIRVRNTWVNPPNAVLPNGAARDYKNIDARVRVNMAFDVNEWASAFVQFNAAENWGTTGGLGNIATGEGTAANPFSTNLNTGVINQAYFTAYDLFGDGGEFKLGRSYYTLGSGRILATDDWSQTPSSYSGIWYYRGWDEVNLEAFMITDVFSGAGLNGAVTPSGDVDLYGAYVDFTTDALGDFIGELTIAPYFLRSSVRSSPANPGVPPPLGPLPPVGVSKNWFGAQISGTAAEDAVRYDLEAVWVDSSATGAPSAGNFNAWALDVDIDTDEWIDDDIPQFLQPVVEFGWANVDTMGVSLNPAYNNVAGQANLLGTTGIYSPGGAVNGVPGIGAATGGGVWNGLADTWQLGLRVPLDEVQDDLTGSLRYVHLDDNTGGMILPGNASEYDVALAYTFEQSGMSAWLGYSAYKFSQLSKWGYTIYLTVGLPF